MKTTDDHKRSDGRFSDVLRAPVTVVILLALIAIIAMIAGASNADSSMWPGSNSFTPPIYGRPKESVLPLLVLWQGRNWETTVYFTSTRPVSNDWWLCVTNRIGCQLHLWDSDGAEVHSKEPDIRAACGCQSSLFALFPLTAGGGEGSQRSQTGYLHYSVQAVVGQADA
jgi:hypothetical protein